MARATRTYLRISFEPACIEIPAARVAFVPIGKRTGMHIVHRRTRPLSSNPCKWPMDRARTIVSCQFSRCRPHDRVQDLLATNAPLPWSKRCLPAKFIASSNSASRQAPARGSPASEANALTLHRRERAQLRLLRHIAARTVSVTLPAESSARHRPSSAIMWQVEHLVIRGLQGLVVAIQFHSTGVPTFAKQVRSRSQRYTRLTRARRGSQTKR